MNNTAWRRARHEAAQQYETELDRPCPPIFAHVRVHDLKHTYGRRLRSAGVSLETRKLLLGHKNGDIYDALLRGGDRRTGRSHESDLRCERHAEHYAPPRGERVNRGKSRAGVAQKAESRSRRTG
jgi:integrase